MINNKIVKEKATLALATSFYTFMITIPASLLLNDFVFFQIGIVIIGVTWVICLFSIAYTMKIKPIKEHAKLNTIIKYHEPSSIGFIALEDIESMEIGLKDFMERTFVEAKQYTCPACGLELEPGVVYCVYCGKHIFKINNNRE